MNPWSFILILLQLQDESVDKTLARYIIIWRNIILYLKPHQLFKELFDFELYKLRGVERDEPHLSAPHTILIKLPSVLARVGDGGRLCDEE